MRSRRVWRGAGAGEMFCQLDRGYFNGERGRHRERPRLHPSLIQSPLTEADFAAFAEIQRRKGGA
jgi:hypothetical protein